MAKKSRVRKRGQRGPGKLKAPDMPPCTALVCLPRTRSPRHEKLDDEAFYHMLRMIADPFYSDQMIADKIKDLYEIEIHRNTVTSYRRAERYQELIKTMREILAEDLSDIPIATKRGRIQYLQEAAERSRALRIVDLRVDKDGGEHFLEADAPENIPAIAAQARREMEGPRQGAIRIKAGDVEVEAPKDFQGSISITQVIKQAADQARKDGITSSFMRERLADALKEADAIDD
jgi:hypothetical protein